VASKAKKARRRVRKELKRVAGRCLGCGRPLRRADARCKTCRRPSPLYAGTKSVSALLVKSAAGGVTPIWAARGPRLCPLGHGKGASPAARFCGTCGTPLGLDPAGYQTWLGKTQAPGAGSFLAKSLDGEHNPGRREHIEHAMYEDAARRGEIVPFLVKVHGYASLEQAAREETDPALQEMFWRALNPQIYGPGGAA
jgi:hypothetical protein